MWISDNSFPVEKGIDRRFPATKIHVERNPTTICGREFPWEFSRADVGQIAMSNPDEIAFIGISLEFIDIQTFLDLFSFHIEFPLNFIY